MDGYDTALLQRNPRARVDRSRTGESRDRPAPPLCNRTEGNRPPDWRRGLAGSTGDESDEPALGYWLGQPYWGNGYSREAAAAVIDYGFRTLGLKTIRAYTDPSNTASQKMLLHCA
ncbi:MAG: GNAT family N-acetyltransferase [Deltaproteobacteria bacterium]|nr:GNAT family N-acetyltransferase [Deltaproteobacteria bacterium]